MLWGADSSRGSMLQACVVSFWLWGALRSCTGSCSSFLYFFCGDVEKETISIKYLRERYNIYRRKPELPISSPHLHKPWASTPAAAHPCTACTAHPCTAQPAAAHPSTTVLNQAESTHAACLPVKAGLGRFTGLAPLQQLPTGHSIHSGCVQGKRGVVVGTIGCIALSRQAQQQTTTHQVPRMAMQKSGKAVERSPPTPGATCRHWWPSYACV